MEISRRIGWFRRDRAAIALLVLAALLFAGRAWLRDHPQHNPWAPLDLRDPPGWAAERKLAALRGETADCRAVLVRSDIAFAVLEPAGEGACRREDRTVLAAAPLTPARPPTTCAVAAGFEFWLAQKVQPAANALLKSPVVRIEQLGTYSCRRVGGGEEGRWSEHATGNAIDIAAFVTEDGRRISILQGWNGDGAEARFLRLVRDEACGVFGTVLSPDYNEAHRDHLHLDQAARGFGSFCR
jgi:hypothetical protein